ncbi:hypothetical protein [Arthrobacter sp. Z1-15]
MSSLASIDRGIRVEAGTGSGDGVTDVTFEYETMSLPSPPIPSAWYLIVRRRNWSGTGTSTLVPIRGTATKALPTPGMGVSNRRDTPGTESDQPLALVRVTQKDTTVQEIVDLRCWASNGGVEIADELALTYLGTPGAEVKLGSDVWRFESKGNGVWGWGKEPRVVVTAEGATVTVPYLKTGTVTIASDANGAAAVRFASPFPARILGATFTQSTAPNLGLIHAVYDEQLSNSSRVAVFLYDRHGERLRNTAGVRMSFIAWGD